MKVLVTGIKDQLGHDMVSELALHGIEGISMGVEEMDITDCTTCGTVISQERPDAVIHCAAYTAVDATEDSLEPCRKVNAEGTRDIARVCRAMDIKMVCISTGYVFNGGGQRPRGPDDHREPLNVYELTEHRGEIAVEQNIQRYFVMRIAWVFGANSKNFIKTMLRLGRGKGAMSVMNGQIGSSTYAYDLARLLMDMTQTDKYGRYHATNKGLCSWYESACEIFRQADMDEVKVTPMDSDGFPAKVKWPSSNRMSREKLTGSGFERLPSWQDTLGHHLKVLKENGMI